jgi:hypothetical protein
MHDSRIDPGAPAGPDAAAATSTDQRILDPIDRNSEVLFGLLMVLTFTGTLAVATSGRDDVRTMLIAAIGCNTAWGLVDAVMYVMRNLVGRAREATIERGVRAATPEVGQRLIVDAIGPLAAALDPPALERVRRWALEQPVPKSAPTSLRATDFKGALAVFLLVFASTFPVVLPFIFISDLQFAKRLSAAIAIALMYRCGHQWGRYGGLSPWRAGVVVALLGSVIEIIVIALGG